MEGGVKGKKRRPLAKVSFSSSYVGDRRRRRRRRRKERRREIFKGKGEEEEFGDREIGSCPFGRGEERIARCCEALLSKSGGDKDDQMHALSQFAIFLVPKFPPPPHLRYLLGKVCWWHVLPIISAN